MQQGFGRDTANVETHTTQHLPAVDQYHLLAQVGGTERSGVAAGPSAEHEYLGVHIALSRDRRLRARARPRWQGHRAGGRCGRAGAQHHNRVPFGNPVARRDADLSHRTSGRSRYLHAGLVRLQRNQRIFRFDDRAGRDVDLDDLDLFEVANVRDFDLHQVIHAARGAVVGRPRVRGWARRCALLDPLFGRNARGCLRLEQHDEVAFRHPVARLDADLGNRPGLRTRHLQAGLVRLQRDQRIFRFDLDARCHVDLDHRHVFEVADVRYADLDSSHAFFSGQSTKRRTSPSTCDR